MHSGGFTPNDNIGIKEKIGDKIPDSWVSENTAILIMHGIGDQRPLETIEGFGKALVNTYRKYFGYDKFIIEHKLKHKTADNNAREWYDNYLRIRMKDSNHFIDLYEYYWAHHTEGAADWEDINKWLTGVTDGAKKFYTRNVGISETVGDYSSISSSRIRYMFFIGFLGRLILLSRSILKGINSFISKIPVIGGLVANNFNSLSESTGKTLANIIGDIVAYTVTDAKSKYYPVRRSILDGGVNAIKSLMEDGLVDKSGKGVEGNERTYPKVIIGGHSLGSVVSFDAINRINLLVNNCLVETYDNEGFCKFIKKENKDGTHVPKTICDQLSGYITFGSPLDKVAFFLRENIPEDQFVRQQMLNHFMNFKQRDWTPNLKDEYGYFEIENHAAKRLMENMRWTNYYDRHDYVSGDLDFYAPVRNVDCGFKGNIFSFTHSDYWKCEDFYKDIIMEYLQ